MRRTRTSPARCAVTLSLALTLLASCGGGDSSPPLPTPAPTTPTVPAPDPSPSLPPALPFKVMPPRSSLAVNDEGRLTAIGTGATVTWTSSDPAVVQVDASGAVTALARGSATITATDGSRTSSATIRVWRTEGANADPSTESLIADALAGGRISAEDALIYRVYAQFGDDRLPAEYDGPPDVRATVSMRHVSGQLSSLSPAAQDILRPFLIPPIYAESWYGRQLGLPAPTQGQARAAQLSTGVLCSAAFVDTYVKAGLLVRRSTAQYNLFSWVSPFGNETALLDAAALEIEAIDAALRSLLGGRHAKPDAAVPCNGGDGAIDVYFVDPGASKDWGATTTYPGSCENAPAYVLINKFHLGGIFQVNPVRGRRYLRTILAHELMHTIQYGMDRSAACADYDWIDEATAQWVPDHLFPNDNEEDGFEKLGVGSAARSGKFYVDYLKGGHTESIEKANGYSTYIFFQFMARKYGATAIKVLFDSWASHDSVASLDVTLRATGSNLRDAWPEFGKALWNDVDADVLTDLRGWDGYDLGKAKVAIPSPVTLGGDGRATIRLLGAKGGSIAARSLAYERLAFGDNGVAGVLLSNPLGSLPQAQHLKLTAVKKIGGQWREPEDWTDKPTKFHCRDKQDERLEELVLIVSNSNGDPDAAPVVLQSDTPFEISVSNVGCWKWQGQATVQTISDDGINNGDLTSRATDLVFEPPADFDGGIMTLSVVSGTASGLATVNSVLPIVCQFTITGPSTPIRQGDAGIIWFNLDLKHPADRKVSMLSGVKFIDSTQVGGCNGQSTVTPAPSTAWIWLLFPLSMHPLEVSTDGRRIEANVTFTDVNTRTVHNFSFTAKRE